MLVFARHAHDGAEWLAVEDDDPLVALAHGRQVALRHHQLGAVARRQLEQRVQIPVAAVDVQHARRRPQPSSGLTIISPPSVVEEGAQAGDVARHEALGDHLGEVERVELLVGVAQAARRVHARR